MPAKGAQLIETEAPEQEPQSLNGPGAPATGVVVSGVRQAFSSRRGEAVALEGLSFSCAPGEVLGVVGPSGCGKSTLLELVAGLQDPHDGTIEVGGCAGASERLARCALMPQRDLLLPWRSALDNAALALELHGLSRQAARRRAAAPFERFGLAGFARARPSELSGGMRQRVAFLRTLLVGKPVLLLDEPFGSLDSITRAQMQEWLAATVEELPRTVLLVTHDVEEALFLCDRVLVLSRRPGRVIDELANPLARRRPRRETVSGGDFGALKERALEALA
jgi:NitT/TauT family transport system ATP-binding protein